MRLETVEHSPLQIALLRRLRAATSGEFEIVRDLGHGGMARVYLAYEVALNRHVALKVLSPLFGEYPEINRRFQHEARTAAQLNHPHIVPVFTVYQGNGLCFFTMPYVDGPNLRQMLDRSDRLPVPTALEYLTQAASALAYAHEHGVVHRDVKPENMLLESSTSRLVLTDFGLAKALGSKSVTIPGDLVGTPHYMAPEQCEAQGSVDARSDQYSLALVAYEMFAGAYPFNGLGLRELLVKRLSDDPPPLRSTRADVPIHVSAAIQRALSRNPDERFPSIEAFVRTVSGARSGVVVSKRLGAVRTLAESLSGRLSAASLPTRRQPQQERRALPPTRGWKVWATRAGVVATVAVICYLAIAAMSGEGQAGEGDASRQAAAQPVNPRRFVEDAHAENLVELAGPPEPVEDTKLTGASISRNESDAPGPAAIEATARPTARQVDRGGHTQAAQDVERSSNRQRTAAANPGIPVAGKAVRAANEPVRSPKESVARSAESTAPDDESASEANSGMEPQTLFESYRRALELKDLEGLRVLHLGPMPASEEGFLSKMFEHGEGIGAEMKLVALKVEGRRATADVDFPLTYVLTRTKWSQQHTLKLRLDLVRGSAGWLIQNAKRR